MLKTGLAISFVYITLFQTGLEEQLTHARENAEANRKALLACKRYMDAWLEFADPITSLIPRNLSQDFYWNAKDAAADNYPFMVLSAFFTARPLFETKMKEILSTEQQLCNRLDRLPDTWDFKKQHFATDEYDLSALIFGAAEYCKDGLIPILELLGPTVWSDRMEGMLQDIWKHAKIQTEVGVLPDVSHEVAGDLLQALSRIYWCTRNEQYKNWVFQLADYFLLHHLPTDSERLQLDDHGCEVIGGLAEAYVIAAFEDPQRHLLWKPRMHLMLDRILDVARDENGLFISVINPQTGKWLTEDRTDNWGYTYNAFLTVAMIDGDCDRYVEAVKFVLGNLMNVADYPWEGDIADGIADSLEGGLNLINRLPNEQAQQWADHMAKRLLAKQRDTGIIEGWHGDGNFARTALMFAFWKSAGAYVHPWRSDIGVGALLQDSIVTVVVTSQWPYEGTLFFDRPRHREYLKMPKDYPRLNQFPEWFVVGQDDHFSTENGEKISTEMLRQGLQITVNKDKPFVLVLKKEPQ